MAAINAIATMFKAGDHVVCGHNLYGGTPRLFNQVLATFGMEFSYVDTADVKNVERAIRKNTRMVFVETPTNPLMALSDLRAIGKVCRARKVQLGRRQYVYVAILSAPDCAWRGHGGAFDNEVSQRSQRWVRRCGRLHQQRAGRETGVSAKGCRSDSFAHSSAG